MVNKIRWIKLRIRSVSEIKKIIRVMYFIFVLKGKGLEIDLIV